MFREICLVTACLVVGCSSNVGPTSRDPQAAARSDPGTEETIASVRRVIAKHLNVSADRIVPEKTFADHGLDSLDLVEIVMLVEDELHISIDDKAMEEVTGGANIDKVPGKLTIAEFGRVVARSAPSQKGTGNN